jgi:hypothetical protein
MTYTINISGHSETYHGEAGMDDLKREVIVFALSLDGIGSASINGTPVPLDDPEEEELANA